MSLRLPASLLVLVIALTVGSALAPFASAADDHSDSASPDSATWQPAPYQAPATKQLYLGPGAGPFRLTPIPPPADLAGQFNLSLNKGDSYDFDLDPRLAREFRVVGLNVILFLDSKSNQPKNLDVNLTLMDWNGVSLVPVAYHESTFRTNTFDDYEAVTFPFGSLNATFASGQMIRLRVRLLGTSDDDGVLATNSAFAASRLETSTTTYVRVDVLELRDGRGPATAWSPMDPLVVRANVSDPFGASEISGARVNITAPGGAVVAAYASMSMLLADPGANPAWKLFEYTLPAPLANGTYQVVVTAIEANGVTDAVPETATVRAPRFTLTKATTAPSVKGGDRFTYRLFYNNTGTGSAGRVWINDSLPAQVSFVSSSEPAAMTGNYNWSWTGVAPGAYVLDVEVQVRGGFVDPFFRNTATLEFTDEKGYSWNGVAALVDVVLRGPAVSFAISSSVAWVHAGERLNYTFVLVNTGEPAGTLWINDTLPAGLTYESDDVGTLGGSRTLLGNVVRFVLTGMPADTLWSFSLRVRASPSLVLGQILTDAATLNLTNENGASLPGKEASVEVTSAAPLIPTAALQFLNGSTNPGDTVAAAVDFVNSGNEPASDVWINLTLDPYLGFVNASAAASVSGNVLQLRLSDVALGPSRAFLNFTILPGVPDRRSLSVDGTLEYTDGCGGSRPGIAVAGDDITSAAPSLSLIISPADVTLEVGTRVVFTIYHSNAGSGAAGDVWLNLTLPASFVYVSDTSGALEGSTAGVYRWRWQDLQPGQHTFLLDLLAKNGIPDGSTADLLLELGYTDANGNLRGILAASTHVTFFAPAIALNLTADRTDAAPGSTVVYTLRFRNAGSTAAGTVWIVDIVDPRLQIVSYTSRVRADETDGLNWTYQDLLPGQEETILIVARIAEGVAGRTPITSVVEATFTNSRGTVLGYVRSSPVTVLVAVDLLPILVILGATVAVGAAAATVLFRRIHLDIEEVFLVYRDGVLMYHLSRSLVQDKDEDVLTGMLTAVQEFIRDAFRYGERQELSQLDFGDYRILIERGRTVYLAVVYSGKESAGLRRRVRKVLDDMEGTYGPMLDAWDGDMDKVVGARDLIRDQLFRGNGRAPRAAAP